MVLIHDTLPADQREDLLNAMADEGAADKSVRSAALWLVDRRASELGRDITDTEAAQALLDGLHELAEYDDDPDYREEYNRAVTSLVPAVGAAVSPITGARKGRGDCDDLAVLFVAMARAVGLSAQVLWLDQPRASFNHIAAAVCEVNGTCHWVETTLPGARVDEHPYAAAARLGNNATTGLVKR